MDDGSPIGYIVLIVFLLFGGAYFAGSETALASVNRIRILSLSENGDKRAKRVQYILDHFDQALTTLLIGNNIMHIACASTATLLASKLWGVSAVTLATFATTFVVFLFAEMLPKRLAKMAAEPLAKLVAPSLLLLMKLFYPISLVFSALSHTLEKPFQTQETDEPTVTEGELYDMLETAANEGVIDEETTELVQSALEFSETTAADILTPWPQVVCITNTMDAEAIVARIKKNVHSRLPVVDEHGAVVGMLQIRKFLKAYLKGSVALADVTDAPKYVSAHTNIDDLLPAMSEQRTQLAIVRSDAGETLGVVSVEDILEELVGEIYDEDDVGGSES